MLKTLLLHNFRNYEKREFKFNSDTTLFVGPNAVGKTNILEAIYELATGHSFRVDEEREVIKTGETVTAVTAVTTENLEIVFDNRGRFTKTYKINGVGKRLVDFAGLLRVVLFEPQDIEIVADSPSTRRKYLDMALSQTHRDYRVAISVYERALRQRNRILQVVRDQGLGVREQLDYWDNLLIENGKIIHEKRKKYLEFLSGFDTDFFPIKIEYDHSIVSKERLGKYAQEELAAGVTLVGPHRDDFKIFTKKRNLKTGGSRGEQRMAVFTMKLAELEYVSTITGERPTLLLDDIFSELDHTNRHRLLEVIPKQQTIMTTTDLHLVQKDHLKGFSLMELPG